MIRIHNEESVLRVLKRFVALKILLTFPAPPRPGVTHEVHVNKDDPGYEEPPPAPPGQQGKWSAAVGTINDWIREHNQHH